MNHKRKKPKNRRSGCLMCKPHKANGAKCKEHANVKRKIDGLEQDVRDYEKEKNDGAE